MRGADGGDFETKKGEKRVLHRGDSVFLLCKPLAHEFRVVSVPDLSEGDMESDAKRPRVDEEEKKPEEKKEKEVEEGEDEVPEGFECALCLDWLEEAVTLSCCHNLLCRECVLPLKECPHCRAQFNLSIDQFNGVNKKNSAHFSPNIPIQRIISSYKVKCATCHLSLCRGDRADHALSCNENNTKNESNLIQDDFSPTMPLSQGEPSISIPILKLKMSAENRMKMSGKGCNDEISPENNVKIVGNDSNYENELESLPLEGQLLAMGVSAELANLLAQKCDSLGQAVDYLDDEEKRREIPKPLPKLISWNCEPCGAKNESPESNIFSSPVCFRCGMPRGAERSLEQLVALSPVRSNHRLIKPVKNGAKENPQIPSSFGDAAFGNPGKIEEAKASPELDSISAKSDVVRCNCGRRAKREVWRGPGNHDGQLALVCPYKVCPFLLWTNEFSFV